MAADPLTELRDIHPIPQDGMAVVADTLAALAVGLILASLVGLLLRLLSSRRQTTGQSALARLDETRALPPDERLFAQAKLLRDVEVSPDLRRDVRDVLYRPTPNPDVFDARIEQALRRRAS